MAYSRFALPAASVTAAQLKTAVYPISVVLSELRQVTAIKDALPDAPDTTSLGHADAAGSPVIGTVTNNSAESETAAFDVALPANYVDGEAVVIRIRAKATVTRNTSQSVDLTVKQVTEGALGGDICATGAITYDTSLTNHDFTVTPTGLIAGDVLHCEVTLATDDGGGGVNGYPVISAIQLRPTVRV